jgi:hypothetical protein
MKKLLSVFVAVAMVMGFAVTASAADAVDVTLTSPTITKAEGSCEKAGAVTFEFSAGAVLEQGDWWYMDLPEGATLCKDIDYLIIGDNAGPNGTWVGVTPLDPTLVYFEAATEAIGGGDGTNLDVSATGPITVQEDSAGGTVDIAGNVALRVIGKKNTRRVTLYVASDVEDSGSMTVNSDTRMQIKILDGQPHAGSGSGALNSRIILDVDKETYDSLSATTQDDDGIFLVFGAEDGETVGGETVEDDEFIDVTNEIPHVENTLCINAEDASGNIHVSFASKNDFLTFTGDSQIAHTGGGVSFTLKTCTGKDTSTDYIEIGTQDSCLFDYDDDVGYCTGHDDDASKVYMQAASTFGEIDERFDLSIEIATDGVYFSGAPTLTAYLASGGDACENEGADSGATFGTFEYCSGTSCSDDGADVDYLASSDTSCTIDDENKIDRVFTQGGAITEIQNSGQILFDFAPFHYESAVVADQTPVTLEITLDKYPCGTIGTETITIGTFVEDCPSSGSTDSSSLFFPFLPGSQFVGWWGGYVVANGSTTAGAATLTATDANGNSATYEVDEVAARGMFNASFLAASDWTQSSTNTENFDGSENYTVFVSCEFGKASGMCMLGNSTEGVGYTAETTGWQ